MAEQENNTLSADSALNFGMTDYFCSKVLPTAITANQKITSKPVPHIQHDNLLLLLIHSGSGRIMVNHDIIPIRRGTLMCLGPFHNYSILPDEGQELKYSEAYMSSGAYMYLLSCPYLKVNRFVVPSSPPYTRLNEKETIRAEEIMASFTDTNDSQYFKDKLDFFYIMELFGILMAKYFAKNPQSKNLLSAYGSKYKTPFGAERMKKGCE